MGNWYKVIYYSKNRKEYREPMCIFAENELKAQNIYEKIPLKNKSKKFLKCKSRMKKGHTHFPTLISLSKEECKILEEMIGVALDYVKKKGYYLIK